MARVQSRCRTITAYAGVLVALAICSDRTRAQAVVAAEPIPGLGDAPDASIRQITRDGARVVVTMRPGGYTIVLDSSAGETLFDERTAAPNRRYSTATLSPEGSYLAVIGSLPVDRVHLVNLATGEEHVAFNTGSSVSLAVVVSDQGSVAATYTWYSLTSIHSSEIHAGAAGQSMAMIDHGQCPTERIPFGTCPAQPIGISADGRYVMYAAISGGGTANPLGGTTMVKVADLATGRSRLVPVEHPELGPYLMPSTSGPAAGAKDISGDGSWIGVTGQTRQDQEPRAALVARATERTYLVAPSLGNTYFMDLSDAGRFVLLASLEPESDSGRLEVVDRTSGLMTRVTWPPDASQTDYRLESAHLSGDGRTVVGTLLRRAPAPGPNRRTFIAHLDRDSDGLHDTWESTYGLNPADPADAPLDPDADGRTNAQEFEAGTHPRGTPLRYFAEGANGSFFATSLALFNPTDADVTANVRFLGADGTAAAMPFTVPAQSPAYLDADEANLPFTEFSIVVESPVPLVAERRMTWDRARRYGSHASNGVAAPSRTWHFAEGATIAGLQTFFLLQNPGAMPATVLMRYLLTNGTVELRPHVVPPASRLTVWVNQEGGPLGAAEFSTVVEADLPIVAERAMYRDAQGEVFAAGSVAAGRTTPAGQFLFAEGATGAFFDTYLLIANPGDAPANVIATYLRPFDPQQPALATRVERTYVVDAHSRRTIWVAQEAPELRDTAVSARVSSNVPIVAERAMWWPGPTADTWHGSHAEVGDGWALTWVAADLTVADEPSTTDAFMLLYAAGAYIGVSPQVLVSLSCADGTRAARTYTLPWTSDGSRTTLWLRQDFPEILGHRCAAVIESLPVDHYVGVPAKIVRYAANILVESAVYGGNFASGTAALATPLPYRP